MCPGRRQPGRRRMEPGRIFQKPVRARDIVARGHPPRNALRYSMPRGVLTQMATVAVQRVGHQGDLRRAGEEVLLDEHVHLGKLDAESRMGVIPADDGQLRMVVVPASCIWRSRSSCVKVTWVLPSVAAAPRITASTCTKTPSSSSQIWPTRRRTPRRRANPWRGRSIRRGLGGQGHAQRGSLPRGSGKMRRRLFSPPAVSRTFPAGAG